MDQLQEKTRELVAQMTLTEKASLTSGKDVWHTKAIERLGIPSIMVADGPHGLRKQVDSSDNLGLKGSVPATCFPTASATACSFDRALLCEIGEAIGEECREEDVSVVLGPGVNIKRSPLCGRNFEYFSEDPCLAGELAAAFITGVQSQNVGTSLKHFALNDQETRRMTSESVCDERAFREIYLPAFERAVKKARPWTVMSSYNMLFGKYASDNRVLLTNILREEWGYDGLVVSDWGGTNDRVPALHAGMDVEMPGPAHLDDVSVAAAVRSGALKENELNESAARVIALVEKSSLRRKAEGTKPGHHALAKRAARESAVLLKNDGALLPGNLSQSAAVIGAFAKSPRYQGAGSSKINPTRLDNAFDELTKLGLAFDYADGYDLEDDAPDEEKILAACRAAEGKQIVYLFAGLPDSYESEGYDRVKLTMPESHVQLIRRVAKVNPNVVVILSGGSVIDLAWENSARAILLAGLSGQAGAGAIAELLLGMDSPCGKLAETWCLRLEDNPSFAYFPGYPKTVEYRESIYVGYRYYDKAEKPVRYPFGHGLSYTTFAYENVRVAGDLHVGITVSVDVINTGDRKGAEIVQLYVAPPASRIYKAAQELKGFTKLRLQPGERRTATFALDARDFAFYDVSQHAWRTENGVYGIRIGASSRDIHCEAAFTAERADAFDAPIPSYSESAPCYYDLSNGIQSVPDDAFAAVLGREIPPRERIPGTPHTRNSTFTDIQDKWIGRRIAGIIDRQVKKMYRDDPAMRAITDNMMADAPLRMLLMTGSITLEKLDGLVDMLNGKFFRGLGALLKK